MPVTIDSYLFPDIDNQRLVRAIYADAKTHPEYVLTRLNKMGAGLFCTQSYGLNELHRDATFQWFFEEMRKRLSDYGDEIMKAWYCIEMGGGSEFHTHDGSFQAAYYVKVPPGAAPFAYYDADQGRKVELQVQEGQCIVFPSSLPHGILRTGETNLATEQSKHRVTVPFIFN